MMVLVRKDVLLVLLLSCLSIAVQSFVCLRANTPFCLRSRGLGADLSKLFLVVKDQDHSQMLRPHSQPYFRALKTTRYHLKNSEEEDEPGRNSARFTEGMTCPTDYHQVADIQDLRCKAADNFNGSREFELKKQQIMKEENLRDEANRAVKQQKITREGAKAEAEWHTRYEASEKERAVYKAEGKTRPNAWALQPEMVGAEERMATLIGKANASSSSLRETSKTTVADAFLKAEKSKNVGMDESSWNHSVGNELERLIAKERGLAAERGFIEL